MENQNYSLTAIRAKRMEKKRGYQSGDDKSPFHSFRQPEKPLNNEIDTTKVFNYFFLWKNRAVLLK